MEKIHFLVRALVYLLALVLSWYGLGAVNYEKLLRKGHVGQAQLLYFLIAMGLAYLAGSFVLALVYRF